MANIANDLTITSLETITGFDITTGNFLFTLDELQNATISHTQEKEDITGKQGRKLNSLKKNKGENKTTTVLWTDYLTVASNAATTSYKAVGAVGSEIEAVYVKSAEGTVGAALEQAASAAAGKFAYDPTSKALTFNAGDYADGTEIVVYYKRRIQADVLENHSDNYSKKCQLFIDAIAEDKCANIYRIQFYIPKADFNGEFDLEFGDSQAVHAFEAESLSGACGHGGQLWTYTVFGETAPDVT